MKNKILPCKVAEHGFTRMLERLGQDCSPIQYIREYIQNSMEAIQRTKKTGEILVDVNWNHYEFSNIYRLSFTDNGDGMSGEEMIEYINHLSSSGHNDSKYENYGMGAKIASLTRNPAGISYESWKNGEGNSILVRYDKEQDIYGLAQFQNEDNGTSEYFQAIDDYIKPEIIDQNGTRVTLFGKSLEDDTIDLPEGVNFARESWLYRVINDRYFKIPDDITIRVRIGYDRPREDKKHNHLLIVKGQAEVFNKYKVNSGKVSLSDAKVHWWILEEGRKGHGRETTIGHTAVLFQNEIFDKTSGRGNKAVHFGIIFGQQDIVLYIEPNGKDYEQNTTRSHLHQKNGNPLPWERWQDEFRAKIPTEIKNYIDEKLTRANEGSHSESIKERLKKFQKFYKIGKFRITKSGKIEVDKESLVKSNTGGGQSEKVTSTRGGKGPGPGTAEELLAVFKKTGGTNAEEVSPDPFPKVFWVSISGGLREEGEMEDRAAKYLEKENAIKANADFQGYKDVINHFMEQYSFSPHAEQVVPEEVKKLFEQQLMETVAGALSLKNRPEWTPDDLEVALSEESLTAAVGTRYYIMTEAKRILNSKLGKIENLNEPTKEALNLIS